MNNKKFLLTILFGCTLLAATAQSDSTRQHGFKKQNLFTGGTVSLGFGTGYFLGGINPMLGYRITKWLDGGIAINYTFTQQRDLQYIGDKARQSIYGGGVFTRVFPVHFLFAQAQLEHNFINFKYYFPANSGLNVQKINRDATSLLVGPGYTSGRISGGAYGYVAVLWDVLKDQNSPYLDNQGRLTPQFRAGINIPLFQGKRNPAFDQGGPLKR